ncbi:MAG: LPS export ABC transporter permease LptF [Asticcacaulis sp.]
MRILDRYIFRQLLVPVLGAVAALTAVALLSQSLAQFDYVVEHGQSAAIFLRITLYSLPSLAGLIFPIALFVGLLIALSRLQGEHEFTAMFAAGVPLMKAAAPAIRLGVYFAIISLASNLFLQPLTARLFRQELFEVKTDLVSALVKEGDFATSDTGLTIYVQRLDQNGLLRGIFIRTPSPDGHDMTYSAREGRIKHVDGSTILVMRNGSNQQINAKGTLDHYAWDEYSIDITPYFTSDDYLDYREGDRYMHELFFPVKYDWEHLKTSKLLAEAHSRLSGPLYCLSFVLLAVVAVMSGRYSRNGYAGRIAIACGVAAVVRVLGVVAATLSAGAAPLNILQYLVPLLPILICLNLLRKHDRTLKGAGGGRALLTRVEAGTSLRPAA